MFCINFTTDCGTIYFNHSHMVCCRLIPATGESEIISCTPITAGKYGTIFSNCEAPIRRLAGQVTLAQARRCVRDLERGLGRLDANVNARLLVEVLLLDWPRV